MSGTFPTDPGPYEGSTVSLEFTGGVDRWYPDGTHRVYVPAPDADPRDILRLTYKDVTFSQFSAFESFWRDYANAASLSDAQFTFTHPFTGATVTGILVSVGRKLDYTVSGSCRVSFTLDVEVVE